VRPKLASRPVASVATHRATGGCEAYTARKQAVKVQLRNLIDSRCQRCSPGGRQHLGRPQLRGRPRIAGVPSSGHDSKGIFHKPRRAPHLLSMREVSRTPRETVGGRGRMEEQSYDPIVPAKVENRRASERSGHGTHWREGGNKVTYLLKET
jgi:hypothetical protein